MELCGPGVLDEPECFTTPDTDEASDSHLTVESGSRSNKIIGERKQDDHSQREEDQVEAGKKEKGMDEEHYARDGWRQEHQMIMEEQEGPKEDEDNNIDEEEQMQEDEKEREREQESESGEEVGEETQL